MNPILLKTFAVGVTFVALTNAAIAAVTAQSAVVADGSAGSTSSAERVRDIPLVNWFAPQFFNPAAGISGTMRGFAANGVTAKNVLDLATFIPIAPCRLVDTRGAFSPVYAGGPFSAGEVRVYRASGNCGVPVGNARVKAVSLAVTTPPTPASGDIEVLSEAAPLGGTVVMVIQAGQWNSATTLTAVDNEGDFKVQLRFTPGDVAIDINGYYAGTNDTAGLNDHINIVGTYALNGGVLYVQNNSAMGAAINTYNNGTTAGAMLSSGPNAIDVTGGGLRVRGAGPGSSTFVSLHRVDTSGTGNACIVAGFPHTALNHPDLNGNPNAIVMAGQGIYSYPGGTSGNDDFSPFQVQYFTSSQVCGGTNLLNRWILVKANGAPAFANNHVYPVMIIKP